METQTHGSAVITLAEARVIMDAALSFARELKLVMSIVIVDTAGNVVSSARMDGASISTIRCAEGKAFAAALFRTTTVELGELAKTRPDRYFGIMSMYPGKVYLVGGGQPLMVDGVMFGAVGIAGLPNFVDDQAGAAGIAAWMKFRETLG